TRRWRSTRMRQREVERPAFSSRVSYLSEESLSKLSETLVTLAFCPRAYFLDKGAQSLLAPVIAGCAFRASGVTRPRALEQRFGGRLVEARVSTRRKGIAFSRITPTSVFFDERTRHSLALDGCDEMSQLSRRYHGSCRWCQATRTKWRLDERRILRGTAGRSGSASPRRA